MLTILQGSTFCVSDDDGGIREGAGGFFADDTRFLSRFELWLGGRRPLLLSSARVEYFNAAHFLRNAPTAELARDTVSVVRERFIARGLAERVLIRNEAAERVSLSIAIELGADFVDILTLKDHVFAVAEGEASASGWAMQRPVPVQPGEWVIRDPESELVCWIVTSPELVLRDDTLGIDIELEPGERWELVLEFVPGRLHEPRGDSQAELRFGRESRQIRRSLAAWGLEIPQLTSESGELADTYYRSITDLASLRLRGFGAAGELPAAGMPWFMTLFGRDTLITSLQTLLFGPDLALGALRALAALQATGDHAATDAEPGKIPHEVRRGKAAAAWFPIYYGSVDATPLFLVLLSEVWRWTGDDAIVHELHDAALGALAWIDDYGDRDGDGLVEYERRTERGLANQSWKDSGDSQRFSDGRLAATPIAPIEVQGYVFDAKRRLAELARDVWNEPDLSHRLDREAHELARRVDDQFWMAERGAYALALDREKRQVDSVCSNMGQLLWSGIVPDRNEERLVRNLMSARMSTGWGLRTMSEDEIAYNPISYHNGTVWPHDTSLVAWGLLDRGFVDDAHTLCRGVLDAAASFAGQLPEVFAGFPRDETPFPVAYPTAARPQAWAAAAPILCLRLLLGLNADRAGDRLVTTTRVAPEWLGRLTLTGVRARGVRWDVAVENGQIGVQKAE